MKDVLKIALLFVVLVIALLAAWVLASINSMVRSTEGAMLAVPRELAAIRAAVETLPGIVDRQAAGTRKDAVLVLQGFQKTADSRLASIQADTKAAVTEALTVADERLSDTVEEVHGIREDVKPVLAESQEVLAQVSSAVAMIRPQALGLIAAAKVTAGETAQAARRFDAALPAVLLTWQQIGENSQKTTAATAEVMGNLAAATKPMPKWLRITGAIMPTAAGIITAAAAAGAFQ